MKQTYQDNDGIIDPHRNPFASMDWIHQKLDFTAHRRKQAKTLLGKTVDEIQNDGDRNVGMYPAFVAIRWGFAEIRDNKLMPTDKWNEGEVNESIRKYPDWEKGVTPHTDSKARIDRSRDVEGCRVIKVENAVYRNARLKGFFELKEQDRNISPLETKRSGKVKAEVVCAWYGVIPPTTYPQLDITSSRYEIINDYTGEVADNISSQHIPANSLDHPHPGKAKGQVFTIAKLHYVNGVVYLTASKGAIDLQTLAENYTDTTKSGAAKHPLIRVRTLARLAAGIGLLTFPTKNSVEITDLGKAYYAARLDDKWKLSRNQKDLLCNYILSDYYRTETIYAITTLFRLYRNGYRGNELSHQFAIEIGKDKAWQSDVTYEGFTKFGINYIEELGLMDLDEKDLLLENISKERIYQEKINEVEPIPIPQGKLPRPKPVNYGKSEKYQSNPRRSRTALEAAGYKCELDGDHATFINKKSQKQYMEAHHLIPMAKQSSFEYDIDVPENILCLCPNCHRKIHLADDYEKDKILKMAYEMKSNSLPERGIYIAFDELLDIYGVLH